MPTWLVYVFLPVKRFINFNVKADSLYFRNVTAHNVSDKTSLDWKAILIFGLNIQPGKDCDGPQNKK